MHTQARNLLVKRMSGLGVTPARSVAEVLEILTTSLLNSISSTLAASVPPP
jgi:hypothetical protein